MNYIILTELMNYIHILLCYFYASLFFHELFYVCKTIDQETKLLKYQVLDILFIS